MWHKDFSKVPIEELEKREVFEMGREEISRIEMKRHRFFASRIVIISKTGKRLSVVFGETESFDYSRRLFQLFVPEFCVDI